jgi:hypothetical protein
MGEPARVGVLARGSRAGHYVRVGSSSARLTGKARFAAGDEEAVINYKTNVLFCQGNHTKI